MKKIVILGCENSHADAFLGFIKNDKKYNDVEVVGIYSEDKAAAKRLSGMFGVNVLENYTDAVGKVDAAIVTARHGDNHLKYARPYLQKGMTIFMDKPITIKEEEAIEFAHLCMQNGVKVTGGSSCRFDAWVKELKKDVAENYDGKTIGGLVRCPMNITSVHGGFYFYAQHLVEIVGDLFGRYPKSVKSYLNGDKLTVIFRYEDYDVTGLFVDNNYCYYALRASTHEMKGSTFTIDYDNPCFKEEFDEFYAVLSGGEQKAKFDDFIAPVFVLNAIDKSMKSGNEEEVKRFFYDGEVRGFGVY